ncbi:MAG: hypothetical protein ACYDA8_04320 [Deferrisomatales bacterium]
MKKTTLRALATLAFGLALALPAHAASHGHGGGHGEKKGHTAEMSHDGHMGMEIHESTVEGFKFAYHVMDNKEAMEKMKDMPGMSMKGHDMAKMKSHHLMLYVVGPDGKPVTDAKLGYLVKGPDDKEQKAMAMGMKGGFGADVDFSAKGAYQIKTKAIAGDKTLVDEFTYEVK